MSWPTTFAATGSGTNSASGTTLAISAPVSVTAGDLILIPVKWEVGDSTISCSDGVNTYTDLFAGAHPSSAGAEPFCTLLYAVAATTASITPAVTWGTARAWREIGAEILHPTAADTISLDGTPVAAGGQGTALASGNITTTTQATDSGMAVAFYADYGTTISAEQINGAAATAIASFGASVLWILRYTAGFTGQATATLSFNNWSTGLAAFKIVAGAGTDPMLTGQACL